MKAEWKNRRRLTTSEFSSLAGIAQDDLRYWDGLGLLRPVLHDKGTGCFYYVPEQRFAARFVARCLSKNSL